MPSTGGYVDENAGWLRSHLAARSPSGASDGARPRWGEGDSGLRAGLRASSGRSEAIFVFLSLVMIVDPWLKSPKKTDESRSQRCTCAERAGPIAGAERGGVWNGSVHRATDCVLRGVWRRGCNDGRDGFVPLVVTGKGHASKTQNEVGPGSN